MQMTDNPRGNRGFSDGFWIKVVCLIYSQSDPLAADFDDDVYFQLNKSHTRAHQQSRKSVNFHKGPV